MAIELQKDVVCLARVDFRGQNHLFGIRRRDRRQHMYIIGKTGTGKSALQQNMILQDISNGEGLCVVDPHGELIEEIIRKIPAERMKDVVYFNPADTEFHMGFNVLELPNPKYKHLVASGLMGIFTKIWANVWSARMEYILNNAILALLDTPGTTLLGIPRLLVDKEYRQKVIANIKDPIVRAFWVNEYEQWDPKFRNEAISALQNKVGQFLSTSIIRNVVGQAKSTIDIFDIMNTKKIFLVNVSKGRIGEDNAALLGAMMITKIQLAAMERVRIPEEEREDFYLYVDEFQNFATDSFANILSEARKYRLNLIIAHQYIGQLETEVSTKVRDAVFGNVGTMIVFRVGADDAEFLEKEFEPEFMIQDIVNLPNFHIYVKLMVNGVTSRPFSGHTIDKFQVKTSEETEKAVIAMSRKLYGRSRQEVEAEVRKWSGMAPLEEDIDEDRDESMAQGAPGNYMRKEPSAGQGQNRDTQRSSAGNAPGVLGTGEVERFQTVCASCGKKITLPFKPAPGRSVYCKACLEKAKATGLPAEVIGEERRVARTEGVYSSHLADIGIEFDARDQGGRQSIFERAGMEEVKPTKQAAPAMSLSNLKPVEKKQKEKHIPKPEIDITDLRQAISKTLTKEARKPAEAVDSLEIPSDMEDERGNKVSAH